MAFYKKRVVSRDTAEDIAWRFANNEARAQARVEVQRAFPVLNSENLEAACDFQERRIRELTCEILQRDSAHIRTAIGPWDF